MDLSTEQKATALASLGGGTMSIGWWPEGWMVIVPNLETIISFGDEPLAALDAAWDGLTKGNAPVCLKSGRGHRYVRWTGFMWSDAEKPSDG